jgi:AsmA protein
MGVWRWTRRILIVGGILVALLFAAAATALALVDTNALRGTIERRAEAATGRALRIEGDLAISLVPWLGFEVGRVRLANAPGFGEEPFVALGRAELRVELLSLLVGDVVLDRIVLHGLELTLARNAAGESNWADLGGASASEHRSSAGQDEGTSAPARLRIEGIEVRDANLSWRNAGADQAIAVRDIDLTTGAIAAGQRTPVELDFSVEPEGQPALNVTAETGLTFNEAMTRIRLPALNVDLEARGEGLPGEKLRASLAGDVDVALDAARAAIDPLRLTLAEQLTTEGALAIDFGGAEPQFDGQVATQPFDPRALAAALGTPLPPPSDDQVLRKARIGFGLQGSPARLEIQAIDGQLDDTELTGQATAAFSGRPSIQARLEAGQLDLDRYLPAATEQTEAGGSDTDGAGSGNGTGKDPIARLPLETLRGFDAAVRAHIARLGYSGLDMADVRVDGRLQQGLLTLERAALNTAGGSVGLQGRFDARKDVPAVRLDGNIKGLQAEPVADAFLGSTPIVGVLEANMGLTTRGATLDTWTEALDGQLAATFRDGSVRGFNIAQQLRVLGARLTGSPLDQAEAERRTDFSVLRMQARIDDGTLRSDTLNLRAPLLRVSGSGEANLVARELDYTARIFVTDTLAGQGGEAAAELKGLEVPVRVTGGFADPGVEIQLAQALQERVKARARQQIEEEEKELEKEVEKEKDKAEEKAKDELRKELEEAFQ